MGLVTRFSPSHIAPFCRDWTAVLGYQSADQNGGYLERSGNRAWSGGIFAAGTCCRGGFGKVAVVVVRGLAGGVLGALEAELAGDLVAQGTVFGSQPGDLSAGGVEPLAKRADAGSLRGKRGRGCALLA